MKHIGVTQRVSDHFHGHPHDCLDNSWADLLLSVDLMPVPLPNLKESTQAANYLRDVRIDGLILTGGNDISGLGEVRGSQVSPRRDAFERTAIAWARNRDLPVFAVCRGMQMLNLAFGGALSPIDGHVGTQHSLVRAEHDLPSHFDGMPERFEVNSFHNFAITMDDLAPGLKWAALDEAGNIEALFHDDVRIAGVMWHPERPNPLVEFDRALIARFFA